MVAWSGFDVSGRFVGFCAVSGIDGLDILAVDDPGRALAVLLSGKNTFPDHAQGGHRAAAELIGCLVERYFVAFRSLALSIDGDAVLVAEGAHPGRRSPCRA